VTSPEIAVPSPVKFPSLEVVGREPGARVDVSVVLPVHDEAGHVEDEIARIRRALDASDYTFELIVVDDGSRDGTKEILRGIEGIRLIDLATNRGCGHARRLGTRAARGDVVVWTDADMTYPNDRIAELVEHLDQNGCEQVVGARTTEEGTNAWIRRPTKWFIRKLASYLMSTPIPDLNSGFRAMRRETALPYLYMLPSGFSCVTTITMAFLLNGHEVKYVPVEYAPRAGESKFRLVRDTYLYLLQVIRMIMTFNPLRVFLPLGGSLLLVAVGKTVFDVFQKDFRVTTNAIVLLIVSLQVVALGLLADLICRLAGPRRGGME